MKKIFISLLIVFGALTVGANAQCGDDLLKQALKEMGDSQYIRDFSVELIKDKKDMKTGYVKFSVVMNSKTQYKFNIVNGTTNPEKVVLQLFDGEEMKASNLYKGKLYNEFQWVCHKTGVYNIRFSFKGGAEGCAKSVMSLVKQL